MIEAVLSNGTAEALGLKVTTKTPTLSLCRALVAAGIPDGPLTSFRDGKPCLVIRSIYEAAKFTVRETEKQGPYLTCYVPFPGLAVEA